ncbi:Hypothetical protein RMP42_05809 (plasmid) [Roseomonas mucosa]|nr:Hypothetical protein RMP42_05809 [Roseomonas mucosa]
MKQPDKPHPAGVLMPERWHPMRSPGMTSWPPCLFPTTRKGGLSRTRTKMSGSCRWTDAFGRLPRTWPVSATTSLFTGSNPGHA